MRHVDELVQFCHPGKVLASVGLESADGLPSGSFAPAFGLSEEKYASVLERFAALAASAARTLVADRALMDAVDTLPPRRGETIVALGDSITDDLESWAEILAGALALRRPDDALRVVNAGIGGDTSTRLLGRIGQVLAAEPDWLILLIGTNDACRFGSPERKQLVSDAEMVANLEAIASVTDDAGVELIWMTPPPVFEPWVRADPSMRLERATLFNADITRKAELVRGRSGPVVDLQRAFEQSEGPELFLSDGVHPNLAGQCVICAALLREWAGSSRRAMARKSTSEKAPSVAPIADRSAASSADNRPSSAIGS